MTKKTIHSIKDYDWIKISIYSILGILTILLIIFLIIKPIIIGYSTYQDIKHTNNTLDEYQTGLNQYKNDYQICNNYLTKCEIKENKTDNKLNSLNEDIFDLRLSNEVLKLNLNNTKNNCKLELERTIQKYNLKLDNLKEKQDKSNEDISEELNSLESEVKTVEKNYYNLAKNVAQIICCKEKIENLDINSYNIINDQIICQNNGDHKVSCSFE